MMRRIGPLVGRMGVLAFLVGLLDSGLVFAQVSNAHPSV